MKWVALERVSGGSALPTIWRRGLGLRTAGYSTEEEAEFQAFAELFLKARSDRPAEAVPCPWDCGCEHKVVPQANGVLLGICQCPKRACSDYTVSPEERIPLEVDWQKISRELGRALEFESKIVKLGLYNTVQIGTRAVGGEGVPVIVTLASSRTEMLNVVALMVAKMGKPFVLLAPTDGNFGSSAKEMIEHTGGAFFSLQEIVEWATEEAPGMDADPSQEPSNLNEATASSPQPSPPVEEREKTRAVHGCNACAERKEAPYEPLTPTLSPSDGEREKTKFPAEEEGNSVSDYSGDGEIEAGEDQNRGRGRGGGRGRVGARLVARVAPGKLFGSVLPAAASVSDEELARRTFIAVQQQDVSKRTRRKAPTLYAVFELYCIRELTIPEVARKCGCSIGTVANRLKLLQAKTGVTAEELRRVAPHFAQYRDDVRQGERNLRRRANRE